LRHCDGLPSRHLYSSASGLVKIVDLRDWKTGISENALSFRDVGSCEASHHWYGRRTVAERFHDAFRDDIDAR
jgi:hypothetical protein